MKIIPLFFHFEILGKGNNFLEMSYHFIFFSVLQAWLG